jgi:hypothetical protein
MAAPLVLTLLPLSVRLIAMAVEIFNAFKIDPATPEGVKAQLDEISGQLKAVLDNVARVELPLPPPPDAP